MSVYPVWNKENTYKKYDVVQYVGALYAALSDVPSGVEINDTSKWLMIYKNGALTNHERYQGLLIEKASESGGGTVDQVFELICFTCNRSNKRVFEISCNNSI